MLSATVLITLLTRKQRPCRLTQLVSEQRLHRGMEESLCAFCRVGWAPSFDILPDFVSFPLMCQQCGLQRRILGIFPFMLILTVLLINDHTVVSDRLRLLKDSDLCKPMPMSVSICFPARCEPYESGLHATHARYRSHPSTCAVHSVCQEPAWRHLARNLLQHHHSPSGQSGS